MDEHAQKLSLSRFRREPFKLCYFLVIMRFVQAFNSLSKKLGEATPLPNLDDDLSVQKYIKDRRVIGVC
jgi:hypothetical protein